MRNEKNKRTKPAIVATADVCKLVLAPPRWLRLLQRCY